VLLQTCRRHSLVRRRWRALFADGGITLFVGSGRALFGHRIATSVKLVKVFCRRGKRKLLQRFIFLYRLIFLAGALPPIGMVIYTRGTGPRRVWHPSSADLYLHLWVHLHPTRGGRGRGCKFQSTSVGLHWARCLQHMYYNFGS
jgi:hypothetical protein